ncbi:MAG TPA: hypothetical protein VNG12_12045 [Acidimicrobiales bacterium]|nr:hypothetical protein [Acidimicrobiales bacterium]
MLGAKTVRVGSGVGRIMKRKSWTVTGVTRGTKIAQEILDQWVIWMVTAGSESGWEFDGWGAQVPGA